MSVAGQSQRGAGVAWHVTGIAVAIFFLAPFAIMFLASFRRGTEAQQPPLPPWPTSGFSLDAYRALDSFGVGHLAAHAELGAGVGRRPRC